jgi:hypothetical protein
MKSFKRIGPVSLLILLLVFSCSAFTLSSVKASAQTASSVDQIVTLKPGFNFVSFTVTPPATPAELISKNSNIEDIYLYSAAAGSFLSVSEGSLTTLAIGKGYIIKSKADTGITINGPPAATIGDITLKKGFNLLGVSRLSSASAVNSFTKLLNASSSIGGLYKWSPSAGTFLQVIRDTQDRPIMLDGSDPSLKPGEAYFINALEDTKISYDDDIKLQKLLAGVITDPTSDSLAAGGTYDLSKLKVYAVYSDGSTVEVTASATFAANTGRLAGTVYTAPKYSAMAVITVSYTDAVLNASKDGYFMLAITSSGVTPVKTTNYKCSYKLAPKARVIDEESVVTVSVAAAQVVLSVTNESDAPKAGDILIGYYGEGYLRKAVSVTVQSGQAVVTTSAANLEDAFESLNYSYKGKLSTLQAADAPVMAPGSVEERAVKRFLRSKRVLSPPAPDRGIISKDKLTKILNHAKLVITLTKADITFDPVVEVDMVIEWFTLYYFKFIVGGDMTFDIEFKIDAVIASDNEFKLEYPLYHSSPWVFFAGPVPCSFEWNINLDNASQIFVTGSYSYSKHLSQYIRMGAIYCGGEWDIINDRIAESSAKDDYKLKGGIRMRPNLNIGFALKVAGVAGPKIILEAFLLYVAEMSSLDKVDITVTGGFAARAAFILEVLSWKMAEFRKELASKSWLIYKRSLDFNIANPVISPGGGNYTGPQDVTISCSTAGATIRYTHDGSDPTSSRGLIYSSPIKVSESTLIKAIAYTFETNCSKVVSAEIIINDIPVPQPTPEAYFIYTCLTHNKRSHYCAASGCQGPISASPGVNVSSTYLTMPSVCNEEVTVDGEKRTITRPVYECKIIGTDNFESVKVPEGVQTVDINASGSIKKVILPSTLKTIQKCRSKGLVEVVIPYGVTEINDSGLSSNPNLSSIDLPLSLKKIGNRAFSSSVLTKIVIPDSVTEIGEEAFSNCNKLVEVTMSKSVKIILRSTFAMTDSLSIINGLDGVEQIGETFISYNVNELRFGPNLKSIHEEAFMFGGGIKSLYFSGPPPDSYRWLKHLLKNDVVIYYKSSVPGWSAFIQDVQTNTNYTDYVSFKQY